MIMIIIDMCDVRGWTRDPPLNPSAPRRPLSSLSDSGRDNEQLFSEVKHQQSFQIEAEFNSQIWGDTLISAPHSLCFSLSVETGPPTSLIVDSASGPGAASCATLPLNTTQIKQKKKKKLLKNKQNNFNNQAKRCCMSNTFSLGVYKLTDWLTWLPS